jgi:tRNA dimethylallyltransferase
MSEKKLIVVAGPTAVGKTSVSIALAKHFRTAVVSADSRQIFREMTIGTAKPTPEERQAVPHYFIDSHSVADHYDAARYAAEARELIQKLFQEQDKIVLCGGSGLYIKGVCEGFDEMPEIPNHIRQELMACYQENGIAWLQQKMEELDPAGLQSIDRQNPHRLVRALEVMLYSGQSILSFRKKQPVEHTFDTIKIGLELPREALYARIDDRMDDMIAHGLFEEARTLYPLRHQNALQTVGYQEIFGYMENAYDLNECVRLLKRNSRRYAKRQLTWFKKDPGFTWFHPEQVDEIIRYVEEM